MRARLPYRGDGTGLPDGLALPPARMPLLHRGRALKRWRYVGAYGESFMLCAGVVRIAGLPQSFWAVWDRERGALHERTRLRRAGVEVGERHVSVRDGDVAVELRLATAGEPVVVVSDHGGAHIWTRKLPLAVEGTITIAGEARAVAAGGISDDSAGYYARVTEWEWAAGAGATPDGRAVVWNFVSGVHDAPAGSERTVWVDGSAAEVGPVAFSRALDAVTFGDGAQLRFAQESVRRRRDNLLVVASDYAQPFGTASGTLPGGIEIATGYGVMERHRARW
jgi:hypothetical protein